MSDAPVQKAKKAAKPKKAPSHPKYSDMIKAAIKNLKERGGSSRQAIAKYIVANYKVDAAKVGQHLKVALRNGVKKGTLIQPKGTGASGSFKLSEAQKKPAKAKKPAAKKPKAKKPAGEKKPKAKKTKTPKKKAAAKPKKSPAKKAAKPKKAKSPAKKAAKKTKSPKKAKAAKK